MTFDPDKALEVAKASVHGFLFDDYKNRNIKYVDMEEEIPELLKNNPYEEKI